VTSFLKVEDSGPIVGQPNKERKSYLGSITSCRKGEKRRKFTALQKIQEENSERRETRTDSRRGGSRPPSPANRQNWKSKTYLWKGKERNRQVQGIFLQCAKYGAQDKDGGKRFSVKKGFFFAVKDTTQERGGRRLGLKNDRYRKKEKKENTAGSSQVHSCPAGGGQTWRERLMWGPKIFGGAKEKS